MEYRLIIESSDKRIAVPFGKMYIRESAMTQPVHAWWLDVSGEAVGLFNTLEAALEEKRKILREWVNVARGAGPKVYTIEDDR